MNLLNIYCSIMIVKRIKTEVLLTLIAAFKMLLSIYEWFYVGRKKKLLEVLNSQALELITSESAFCSLA